jgi:putative acetyltransferase
MTASGETLGRWIVRPYRPGDAPRLAQINRAAVAGPASRYYAREQIEAWLSIAPDAAEVDHLYREGRTALVACAQGDLPVAFSDFDADGHIRFVYGDPPAAGQGAPSALMAAIDAAARGSGIAHLQSEASEAALGFFRRQGFTVLACRDLRIGEVGIHNYSVVKPLAARPGHDGW